MEEALTERSNKHQIPRKKKQNKTKFELLKILDYIKHPYFLSPFPPNSWFNFRANRSKEDIVPWWSETSVINYLLIINVLHYRWSERTNMRLDYRENSQIAKEKEAQQYIIKQKSRIRAFQFYPNIPKVLYLRKKIKQPVPFLSLIFILRVKDMSVGRREQDSKYN